MKSPHATSTTEGFDTADLKESRALLESSQDRRQQRPVKSVRAQRSGLCVNVDQKEAENRRSSLPTCRFRNLQSPI